MSHNSTKLPADGAPKSRSGLEEDRTAADSSHDAQSRQDLDMRPARQPQLRPRSQYHGSSSRTEQPPETGKERVSQGLRRPISGIRTEMPPPPTGLSRSQSLRRPTGSMQVSQAANPRSHLRTKSTSTMPGARDASAERVQKGRPRSLLVPPGSAARAGSNSSADLGVRDSSTSVRNADALKRTTSTRVKSAASDINESGETTQIFSSAQQGLPVCFTLR